MKSEMNYVGKVLGGSKNRRFDVSVKKQIKKRIVYLRGYKWGMIYFDRSNKCAKLPLYRLTKNGEDIE